MTSASSGTALVITADDLGGRTGRYEKHAHELAGLYSDDDAFAAWEHKDPDRIVYRVDEFRPSADAGDLIVGISTLTPGRVGREFHMTRGHLHAISDRAEIYECLSGHGLMLMETLEGDTVVTELRPGTVAYVPPHHIHRSVNVGDEDFRTLFCYSADAGQDYEIIRRSHGMRHRVVATADGGWELEENADYVPR